MSRETIEVIYICKGCGARRPVQVPERQVALDVRLWLEMVGQRVGTDHAEKSPHCREQKADLMIPVGDTTPMIGRK